MGMIHYRRPFSHGSNRQRKAEKTGPSKTVLMFFFSTALILAAFFIPFFYIANQNFSFFQDLALNTSPSLIQHLEREQLWFNTILIGLLAGLIFSNFWFAHKLVKQLRSQVASFDRHLKHLIRGDWHIPQLKIREKDEFKILVEQYGYFYRSLQAMTKSEIQILEKMKIDPANREAYTLWTMLLTQKRSRLGLDDHGTLSETEPINKTEFMGLYDGLTQAMGQPKGPPPRSLKKVS